METLAQFIGRLAAKAGIQKEDSNLTALLENAELKKLEVPDELLTGMDNNLLSIAQAVDNHPTIKKKYHAQALNGIDARIAAALREAGLSAEKVAEIEGEGNTYQRLDLSLAAIKEAVNASAAAKHKPEDKTALQNQVNDLLAQLKTQKADLEGKLQAVAQERQKDLVNFEVKNLLGSVKTIFDELPIGAKTAALDSLLGKALLEKGASFAFDEAGQLTLRGKDDAVVVSANNTKLTPQAFIDETLAQNKILKVNEQADPTKVNGSTTTKVTGSNPALTGNSQTIAQQNRAAREQFQKNALTA